MYDQLTIGSKASFDDFRASIAERKIGMPAKKKIKETVPFSNITHDFSRINGEQYWDERTLEYVFELTASTPEELEELKQAFANWVMNVAAEEIHDPHIPDFHFLGTFDSIDPSDDEGLDKTTITVKFTAYPYMIANALKEFSVEVPAGEEGTLTIVNGSSHPVVPTITVDAGVLLKIGTTSYALSAGTTTDERLKLAPGVTSVTVQNAGATACTVAATIREEVF